MTCPYCNETIERPAPDRFLACPQCGFKSARVSTETDSCLIIDRDLPDLVSRYQELQRSALAPAILIDRRVGQTPIAGAERRR
ncbi:MAG: hypothetical protein M1539_03515 [Actinobacteria bacterium]|nr:hypothetical protein [Actinomycetota bacterium]MCL5883025.1 hypothetical protein [Actinomycetota bacterium]